MLKFRFYGFLFGIVIASSAFAGDLNAPAGPDEAGGAMYTIEDIYNRLVNGTAGTRRNGTFNEPTAAPGSTMHNLNDLLSNAPAVDNASGAGTGNVLSGKTFWSLLSGAWGLQTGTMPNNGAVNLTPGTTDQAIAAGYHDGTGKVAGDADLVADNIKAGVNLFGVDGNISTVNTSSGNATAGEVLQGRKAWASGQEVTGTMPNNGAVNLTPGTTDQVIAAGYHDGTGKVAGDADLVAANIMDGTTIFNVAGMRAGGVLLKAGGLFFEGKPRWYVNNDGTITDIKTGLVWLSDIDHIQHPFVANTGAPIDCMRALYHISHGNPVTLTDNSQPGDWDMPTLAEMQSLREPDAYNHQIGISKQAFDNLWISSFYWTSTPFSTPAYGIAEPDKVAIFNPGTGEVLAEDKLALTATGHYVWPVRRKHR
jgi:hypothetical protein